MIVVARQLGPLKPADAFARATTEELVWLDSGVGDPERGLVSRLVLGCERAPVDASGREQTWQQADEAFAADAAAGGIGWVGYISYDAAHIADASIAQRSTPAHWPLLAFRRVTACLQWSRGNDCPALFCCADSRQKADELADHWQQRLARAEQRSSPETAHELSLTIPPRQEIEAATTRVIDAIHRGQIFQGCLTFPIDVHTPAGLDALYLRLRSFNAGDFGVYLRMAGVEVASVSPERLCQVRADRVVHARPMKGTRRRMSQADDHRLSEELRLSVKDRAENVMIVDLLRNDLGRVCVPGTVRVPELFEIETYATVLQMTSTVSGQLREGVGPFTLAASVFPPGSMTGAPKVEACNLLAELEGRPRGLYSGSVAWLGFDGDWAFNVLIRTLQRLPLDAHCHETTWWVGGGIVADSVPADEWEEALTKAAPLFKLAGVNRRS